MKRILLFAALLTGTLASAQTTITSTGDGNASNPFIWDCFCFPTPNDDVIINHDVTMNVDWIVNGGGSITINASGSFIEDAMNRTILVDGAGSAFSNNGFTELTNMTFTNGATGINTAGFLLDTALFVGTTSSFTNTGVIAGTDSVLVNGTFDNGPNGILQLGDLWNNGTTTHAGSLYADSVLNTGSFTSTSVIYCNEFGNDGLYSHSAEFFIANNFYNAGDITFTSTAVILVGNDMLSGDTLGGSASIVNDGAVGIDNDFLNTDALSGSGRYCIINNSTNSGTVTGTLDICDQSPGGGFDVNIGSVAGTVTNCSSVCDVGVEDLAADEVLIYPNPTNNFFTIEFSDEMNGQVRYELFSLTGEVVLSNEMMETTNTVDMSSLTNGVYLCKIFSENGTIVTERIVKN
ncbi:MAG: T9SS type A sorting domain-containing protein [Crocinitomicaceae bacterium]|nr:T9SS type A sorting domain-containing protein [Crocinitomicaceae bacterium]